MTRLEIYNKYLNILLELLRARYNNSGLRASGNYERQLEKQIEGNNLKILGAAYAEQMENGRRAGAWTPKNVLINWIETKQGLPAFFKENKEVAAFLIARKHFREGIKVPNEHNEGKVVSGALDEFEIKFLPEMVKELGQFYITELTTVVRTAFAA